MKPEILLICTACFVTGIIADRLVPRSHIGSSAVGVSVRPDHAVSIFAAQAGPRVTADVGSRSITRPQTAAQDVCARSYPNLAARLDAIREVFTEIAASDGKRAVLLAAEILAPGELDGVLPAIMEKWAAASPEDAIEWYQKSMLEGTMPGGIAFDSKAALLESAFKQLGISDPRRGIELASKLATETEWRIALAQLGRAAVLGGRQADLLIGASTVSDDDQRFFLRSALFTQWAALQPSEAVVGLSNLPDEDQSLLASSLGHAWLRVEPEAAATWWLEQTPEAEQGETLRDIVSQWGALDPNKAASWLNSLPESPAKDAGRAALAHNAFELDVESALTWAASIQSSTQREQTWSNLMHTLYLRDPALAREIIARPETTDECRTACASFVEP